MILTDPRGKPAMPASGGRTTLDELFRRAAQRRPDAIALIDPPNRESFADDGPRHLTYAQADRMVSAIAGRLRRMGLYTDAVVAIQMANTVEGALALLGVLRAGLIAMPLPLLWRRAECVAALSRVGANALIVSGRVGAVDHYELAMHIAAEIFPIRYVCGFGSNPPDGFVPFDDLYMAEELDPIPRLETERASEAGAHLAVITWDVSPDGLVPVGRSHSELIAGGLAVLLEGRVSPDAILLSTLTMSSFAGLATGVLPWLLVGGTLVLHHPFDPDAFLAQRQSAQCDTLIVPGPLVGQLAEAGYLAAGDGLANVIGVWRAPERVNRAPPWQASTRMTDVHVFGETGFVAAGREPDGKPAAIPFGVVFAPRGPKGTVATVEIAATPSGTVALRGPMVPRVPFPPGAERSGLPFFRIADSGFVDTGYACLAGSASMVVTAPPAGIASFGGYRFVVSELQDLVARPENGAGSLAILPDAIAGHRLAGTAVDHDLVEQSLVRLGANPLLVGAFHGRGRRADDRRQVA